MSRSFILKSTQQDETLHRICGKMQLCGSLTAVTQQRGVGWRWGTCQGAHPQVCARGGSSSHLSLSVVYNHSLPHSRSGHR
ncbi:unnamed protein product [Spirodela intermedia]|uniref:Uncharacterized protein n=1 Tax=Spirodela intermedia TaxID=51605 RepID=A0A7I8JTD2_SPIIN|nr:unnamed protein product [Spirodela intermedia]CAA6673428.1 unnamed protein product [Spirodela intermedia]